MDLLADMSDDDAPGGARPVFLDEPEPRVEPHEIHGAGPHGPEPQPEVHVVGPLALAAQPSPVAAPADPVALLKSERTHHKLTRARHARSMNKLRRIEGAEHEMVRKVLTSKHFVKNGMARVVKLLPLRLRSLKRKRTAAYATTTLATRRLRHMF